MDEKIKDKTPAKTVKLKKKSPLVRVIVMVLLLCLVVFGTIIVSDLVARNNEDKDDADKPEYVTICVSGELIYLDGEVVTLDELHSFFEDKKANSEIPETAFITDTLNPADYRVYNEVLSLLSEFDINVNVERMMPPATQDEMSASTKDEILLKNPA